MWSSEQPCPLPAPPGRCLWLRLSPRPMGWARARGGLGCSRIVRGAEGKATHRVGPALPHVPHSARYLLTAPRHGHTPQPMSLPLPLEPISQRPGLALPGSLVCTALSSRDNPVSRPSASSDADLPAAPRGPSGVGLIKALRKLPGRSDCEVREDGEQRTPFRPSASPAPPCS